jgi:hypothetical protein
MVTGGKWKDGKLDYWGKMEEWALRTGFLALRKWALGTEREMRTEH